MTIFHQSSLHIRKSKGPKIKHIVQFLLFGAVAFWLLYQVKNSQSRKLAFSKFNQNKASTELVDLYLGRKGYRNHRTEISNVHESLNFEENVENQDGGSGDSAEFSREVQQEVSSKDGDGNIDESHSNDEDEAINKPTAEEEENTGETSNQASVEQNQVSQEASANVNGVESEKHRKNESSGQNNIESQSNTESEENGENDLQREEVASNNENESVDDVSNHDLSEETKNIEDGNDSSNSGDDRKSENYTNGGEKSNEVTEATSQDGNDGNGFNDSNGDPQGEGETSSQTQEEIRSSTETVTESVHQPKFNASLGTESSHNEIAISEDGQSVNLTSAEDQNVTSLLVENGNSEGESAQPVENIKSEKSESEQEDGQSVNLNSAEDQNETSQLVENENSGEESVQPDENRSERAEIAQDSGSSTSEENKIQLPSDSQNSTTELVRSEEENNESEASQTIDPSYSSLSEHKIEMPTESKNSTTEIVLANGERNSESDMMGSNTSDFKSHDVLNSSHVDDQSNIVMPTDSEVVTRETVESEGGGVFQEENSGDVQTSGEIKGDETTEHSSSTDLSHSDASGEQTTPTDNEVPTKQEEEQNLDFEAVNSSNGQTQDESSVSSETADTTEESIETNLSHQDNELTTNTTAGENSKAAVSSTRPTLEETSGSSDNGETTDQSSEKKLSLQDKETKTNNAVDEELETAISSTKQTEEKTSESSNGSTTSEQSSESNSSLQDNELTTNEMINGDSEASGNGRTPEESSGSPEGTKTTVTSTETDSSVHDNELGTNKMENEDPEVQLSGKEPTQEETSVSTSDEITGSSQANEQNDMNLTIPKDNETSDLNAAESNGKAARIVEFDEDKPNEFGNLETTSDEAATAA